MLKRIALVVGLLFAAVAALSVLVPSQPDGVECGSIVSPDWTDEQTDELIDGARGIYDRSAGTSFLGEQAGQAVGMARNARENNRACEDARGTRKIVAGSAAGLAIVSPLALFFVAGSRREDHDTD